MALSIVILAAGQGTRMRSQLPKVLHRLGGKPLLEHVAQTAEKLNPAQTFIVYGHQGEKVQQALSHLNATWVEQNQQRGTGHALQQALPHIPADHQVLVLYGDVPLISLATLQNLLAQPSAGMGIVTANLANPSGFGRIIRNQDHIVAITEQKDLKPDQLSLNEINSGIYLFPAHFLEKNLPLLQNNNAQNEYYLTDVISLAVQQSISIHSIQPISKEEILGVNDRLQLAHLERHYQLLQAEKLMLQGVTLTDPQRFDLRGELAVGEDIIIDPNVIIEGRVTIGNGCFIGANTILRDVILGDHVEIKANSIIEGAEISRDSVIGPFARIRPGTILAARTHIGNFVEIKNSYIDEGTKVNHLTYVGDSEIGKRVNVGAGTITCNYDGINKHKTIIGDEAFIGSNSALVAPVTIGAGATVGAGSVVTRDAPPHQLTICRAVQRNIENWQRPKKKEA